MVGVTNTGGDLKRALLPAAQPTAGRLCQCAGLNGSTSTLIAQRRLAATAVRGLAAAIRRISLSHADGGLTNCPADDGSADVLAFSFPRRPDVDLWYWSTGCTTVSNGFVVASGAIDL